VCDWNAKIIFHISCVSKLSLSIAFMLVCDCVAHLSL